MNASKLPKVRIYTDGSCHPNPGPGGWAALLQYQEHEKLLTGTEKESTNNRMELIAVIEALKCLKRPCQVEVYTDSEYVAKGYCQWLPAWIKHNWCTALGRPVKNRELWEQFLQAATRHVLTIHWVRGHNGHPQNERVDREAKKARQNRV